MNQSKTKYARIRENLQNWGLPTYRFTQILHALFRQRIVRFEEMTALPLHLRQKLTASFRENFLSINHLSERHSRQARKFLFELYDGHQIETVAMRYRAGWRSYCISTQSGCGFACQFCATGTMGLKRSLTADEITDQILYFHLKHHPIDSISLMGMGEALANPNTFEALHIFTDPDYFGFSPRRLTLSTIGLVPGIHRLSREFPQINVTFSLHSPFNKERSRLVPLNKRYPIEQVMAALDEHILRTRRKVYIAYLLLAHRNDTAEHLEGLVRLLKAPGRPTRLYHVNLIRHNPTKMIPIPFAKPPEERIARFAARLRLRGLKVTVRPSFGREIEAACGQLYAENRKTK